MVGVLLLMSCGTALADGECCLECDCRDTFEASFSIGLAIDTFAASELGQYLNPNDSSDVKQRHLAGFDFNYRLLGNPAVDKEKPKSSQLWVYGKTIHGVRSADVDCQANPNLTVCKPFYEEINQGERALYILRNASTLEASLGLRWEFLQLHAPKDPAHLYLNLQAGFLNVAGSGGDVIDDHHVGLGVVAVNGSFRGSYLEIGYGKTQLYEINPDERWKVDGFLSWKWKKETIRPFVRLTVDADFAEGADSVQTHLGLDIDLGLLFKGGESQGGGAANNGE